MRKHIFAGKDFSVDSVEAVYQGFFKLSRYRLRHRLFNDGWSKVLHRELFQRGNAVGVLVFDPWHDTVGIVEQFRIGALSNVTGPWQYELVAGMVKSGDDPRDVAISELREEAGLEVDDLIPICDYFVSAGGTDEKMYLFCALTDLAARSGIYGLPSEGEDIMFHVWDFEEVLSAFNNGQLNNAAMTISILWLQNRRREFCNRYKRQ